MTSSATTRGSPSVVSTSTSCDAETFEQRTDARGDLGARRPAQLERQATFSQR
jgi:hypothetical protein